MGDATSFNFHFGLISLFLISLTKLTFVSASSVFNNWRDDHSNCTLLPESERMKLELERKIDQGNRLINLDITVQWNLSHPNESYPNKMLWFMTTDATGKHLLSLDENFVVMSLGTLSYRITDLRISLVQEPEDCLGNLTTNDADKLLKFTLLKLPETQKAVNEGDVNILHICTGRADSEGSCCYLSLTNDDIRCQKLLDDKYVKNYSLVIVILTVVLMSYSVYLIPSFIYEEDKDHSYELFETDLKLGVSIIEEEPDFEKWRKVNNSFVNDVCHKIKEKIRNGERCSTFDMFIKSVKRKDTGLVSELSNSGLLQSLYKPFEYIFFRCNLSKKSKLNRLFKICGILFCASPIILRTVASFLIHSSVPPYAYLAFTILFIVFVVANILSEKTMFEFHQVLKKSLRRLHDFKFENKTEIVVYLVCAPFQKKFPWIILYILIYWIYSLFLVFIFSLPAVLFIFIFFHMAPRHVYENRLIGCRIHISLSVGLFIIYIAMVVIAIYVGFYTECIAYIMIGLFLNYEQVIDKVLLILMVLTYIFDCLNNTREKLDSFNRKVIGLLFELSETTQNQLFDHAFKAKANTAMALKLSSERGKENSVKIFVGVDGEPFLSVDGLYLFYKFKKPENMPYLHIPQSFFDELASIPGHSTPGQKHILFLKACREIVILSLAIFAVFFIIQGFARINDISATVHTLVTLGTSVALAMFNRLIFRSFDSSSIGQDLCFEKQTIRHIETFKEDWCEFECDEVRLISTEDDRSDTTDPDYDLLVKISNDGLVEACYLKPFTIGHENKYHDYTDFSSLLGKRADYSPI